MAGTFPGLANAQQQDVNGKALIGAILTIYVGGTTVLANTFQDIGLAIPAQNPMKADPSGRLPLFFVADGTYRVRLTDQFGSTANGGLDYPQVPSIGASSSGGGGSAVDPTTILSTGDFKWQPVDNVLAGFVRANGRTIGSPTSGASERANADTQALYLYLYAFPDAICPVVGGRGANGLSDFNANKQITLFDLRGRAPFGLDTMGNTAAGKLVGATFDAGDTSTTPAGTGGEAAHALTATESAVLTYTSAVDEHGGHTHGFAASGGNSGGGAPLFSVNSTRVATPATDSATTGITVGTTANAGGGSHNTMSPFMLGTWFLKL